MTKYSSATWLFLAWKLCYTLVAATLLTCLSVIFTILKRAGVWKKERDALAGKLSDLYEAGVEEVTGKAGFKQLKNGKSIYFIDVGQVGSPTIMLMHGFPDCSLVWNSIIPMLVGKGYRVIVPDQPGVGLSEAPEKLVNYHAKHVAGYYRELAEQLGLKKYGVVGHDWGAPHAWATGASFGESVSALAVLSTPPVSAFAKLLKTPVAEQLISSWYFAFFQLPVLPEALMSFWPPWTAALLGWWTGQRFGASHVAVMSALLAQENGAKRMINNYRAITAKPAKDIIPKSSPYKMPVLFVTGDHDEYLPPCVVPAAKEVVPTLKHVSLNTGHWIQLEDPYRLAEALDAHFSGLKK